MLYFEKSIMEVIILAGGLGTRLRSVVSEVPKGTAPIAGKPFLWYILKYLTKYNVSKVILSVGYLREVIFQWIDKVKDDFPFSFDYAIEEEPLGTGGGIKLALEKVKNDDVVVLNGDTFFDVDFDNLLSCHKKGKKSITLALKPMTQFDRYGTVNFNTEDRTITQFNEKQHPFLKSFQRSFHLKYQYWNQNVKRDDCRESCKKAISSILESRKIIRRQIKSFLYILKKITDEFIGHRYYRV